MNGDDNFGQDSDRALRGAGRENKATVAAKAALLAGVKGVTGIAFNTRAVI